MPNLFRYETEDAPFAYGGMGEVYQAIDKLSGDQVVIKTIHHKRLGFDDKTIESFFKEAQAGFRLGEQSKHIANVLDIGFEDVPYMAVEYFSGGSIFPLMGTLQIEQCRDILRQIVVGVYHAHNAKVVHSDISPDNVLYDSDSLRFALSDFGLLKILETRLMTRGRSLHT